MIPELSGAEPTVSQAPVGRVKETLAENTAQMEAEGGGEARSLQQQVEHQLQDKAGITTLNYRQQSRDRDCKCENSMYKKIFYD